jgi:hypothetical protein
MNRTSARKKWGGYLLAVAIMFGAGMQLYEPAQAAAGSCCREQADCGPNLICCPS